jgi:predicted secreted protein
MGWAFVETIKYRSLLIKNMNQKRVALINSLKDERSKKVIFLSHCLLNENTRYLGGAFRKGVVSEVLEDIQKRGIGIVQMECPEQKAWGGVLKSYMWIPLYLKSPLLLKIFLPFFIWNTKRIYKRIAKGVIDEIRDYEKSGFHVVGIVGVSASPTCGVTKSVKISSFIKFMEKSNPREINREKLNKEYIMGSLVNNSGLFIEELKKMLEKKKINVRFYEYDFVKEIEGKKSSIRL